MLEALANLTDIPMAPLPEPEPEPEVLTRWLGRVPFTEAYALQNALVEEIRAGRKPEQFLLLEHEPVYTIGRTRDQSSLGETAHLPHPLEVINRGGQATYHGPGQLVGYALLDLDWPGRGRDLHLHLRRLEDLVMLVMAEFGVHGQRREGLTGVWVEDRKICSIGVGVRKWVSMHGIGLNVGPDLGGFMAITPCGIGGVRMTSLSLELGRELAVKEVAEVMAALCEHFFLGSHGTRDQEDARNHALQVLEAGIRLSGNPLSRDEAHAR
jgi:lipoyl(octanoyl) transferase